ncbi:MAG: TetR/AcrR family transcriptional regulator [Steroidobacteraceae bacterium]|nr:TetR/AcrR family transcriptional regulator [Steroidobacteraceae bacterium]
MKFAKPRPVRQERSRETRDSLLAAANRLLQKRMWSELAVTDIAEAAGSSIGSFYARYGDKESFFEALCAQFVERRSREVEAFWASLPPDADLATEVVNSVLGFVLRERKLWHAALVRGASEPKFWEALRDIGLKVCDHIVQHQERRIGRKLTAEERRRIRTAQLLLNGFVNNAVLVRVVPLSANDKVMRAELIRAFRLVAGLAEPGT